MAKKENKPYVELHVIEKKKLILIAKFDKKKDANKAQKSLEKLIDDEKVTYKMFDWTGVEI